MGIGGCKPAGQELPVDFVFEGTLISKYRRRQISGSIIRK